MREEPKGAPPCKKLPGPILLVAPEPFYEDRGTPIAVREVLQALSQNGREVHLLTYPVGQDISLPGLQIHRIPNWFGIGRVPIGFSFRKLILDQFLTFCMARRLRRGGYSCIHAVEEMGFPAVLLGRHRKIPVLWDIQSDMPAQMKKHFFFRLPPVQACLRWCESWLVKRADHIVCSSGLQPQLLEIRPDASVREWRFPSQRKQTERRKGRTSRESLGISPDAPLVVYTGNFEHYQGVDLLVEGAGRVLDSRPDTVFLLLGAEEGRPWPNGATELVESGAMKILNRQPRRTVPDYLALADVAVSPRSLDGNIPLKVFDYMGSGVPVVATDITAHRTVLDEEMAVLVEVSGEGLAGGILGLLNDPIGARVLAESARIHAEEHLSWLAFAQDVARLHEDVVFGPSENDRS